MTASATANRQVLIDTALIRLQTNESSDGGAKKLYAEGKIGHAGVPTLNGRLYTLPIMRREVSRLQSRIEQASLYAAVDHPGDGKSKIMNTGALIRGLRVEDNGEIWGKFEIIEDTDCGRNLAALLRRGAVGVSSRGLGSTSMNHEGHDVVGEDFRLVSFDFVLDPAVNTAYPTPFSEDLDVSTVTVGGLKAKFPKLIKSIEEAAQQVACATTVEAIRTDIETDVEKALGESKDQLREQFKAELYPEVLKELKEDFGVKLVRATTDIRKEVESQVRSEMAADPAIAGAKLTLEQIAKLVTPFNPPTDVKKMIAEKDGVVEELKKSLAKLEKETERLRTESEANRKIGTELGFRLFVEKSLAGRVDANTVREMIGDVKGITTVEELKQKVGAAVAAADNALAEATAKVKAELHVNEQVSTKKADLESKRAQKAIEREELLRDKVSSLTEQVERLMAAKDQELSETKRRVNILEQKLESASQLAEQMEVRAHAATRLSGHPKRSDILRGIDQGRFKTKAQVNLIAEQEEVPADAMGAQERVRRMLGKGREFLPEEQRVQQERQNLAESRTPVPNLEGFDISMEEIKRLSSGGRR